MAKPIEEWTEEELEAFMNLPPWAEKINSTHELVAGAHLPTKDGRIIGNAHIVNVTVSSFSHDPLYIVLTDAGNTLRLNQCEIADWFHPSQFISNVADILHKFSPRPSGRLIPHAVAPGDKFS